MAIFVIINTETCELKTKFRPVCVVLVLEAHYRRCAMRSINFRLAHGQVTIILVVSVGLSVCLSVCLFVCAEFFSTVFDPISIKLYVWV